MECRPLIIVHLCRILMHDLSEDDINKIKDFAAASEILVQIDPPVDPVLHKPFVLIQKDLRSCQTEAVDALLHIPHHKIIVFADDTR